MITVLGEFFPPDEHYGRQEHAIFASIKRQIEDRYPTEDNLIINLTWFGPQFTEFTAWQKVQDLILAGKKFDNLFWTGILDPVTITAEQFKQIEQAFAPKEIYYMGVAFEGSQTFNTHAIVCTEEFPTYTDAEVELKKLQYLYMNYNRKPKPHRILFVEKLHQHKLETSGIFSLGKPVLHYDVTGGLATDKYYIIDDNSDYTRDGKFSTRTSWMFGGVPPDFCSLGDIDIWQRHFLNIVGETEFFPWDNLFITEKTLKPLIGMRPFLINGQVKIYQWLRDKGFRTFNHYFNGINLENVAEYEVHDSIIEVVKYLAALDKKEVVSMYNDMLPDLRYNRERFKEFAQEQYTKVNNIF